MQLFVLGINHRTAPLGVRERFALSTQEAREFLAKGTELPHVEELVALSTCNRVELYGTSRHPRQASLALSRFLADFREGDPTLLEKHSYFHQGEDAVRHGFRVASSLDSMILGENQILGQFKDSYRQALDSRTTGRFLNKFFHRTLYVAKKVRNETAIGAHPVSVSYAAVVLAKQIFGDLSQKNALIIGAGKVSGLAIKHLKSSGIQTFYITNRTPQRAREIAQEFGGEPIPFSNFEKWLGDVDVVISSTNSPGYIINDDIIRRVFQNKNQSPKFFIDLAVPRDISPEVNNLSNVFLYDVDDLGAVVEANKEERMREAQRAEDLLDREVKEFAKVLRSFELVPTISSLSKKFDIICQRELEKAFQKLPNLDVDDRVVVEKMASSIVKKVLHDPMVTLREESPKNSHINYSDIVRKLFRLDEI